MADITTAIEDAGPACKKLTLTIPQEVIETRLQESFGNLQKQAALPGFRRGRAPRRLVEQRFGPGLRDDLRQQLISEAYQKATEEHEIDPISYPEPIGEMPTELPEKGGLEAVLQVEVTPNVTLPDFASLKAEAKEIEVKDEDIENEVATLRTRFGKNVEVEEANATIQAKDFAEVSLKGFEKGQEDGEPLLDLDTTYIMVHGEDQDYKGHVAGIVVENIGKELAGKKAGDDLRIETTGPAMHENEDLREKELVLNLTINKIHRIEDASEEEAALAAGFESAEKLREQITEGLKQRAEQEQKADQHQQLTDQLLDAIDLELPEKITTGQTERLLQRKRIDLIYQGKSPEDVEQQLAELRTESEEEAKKQMKSFFILDKASKDLEVDVDDQEINSQIFQMAQQQNRRPDKLAKEMRERGVIEQIYLQIRDRKTLDKILEKATA